MTDPVVPVSPDTVPASPPAPPPPAPKKAAPPLGAAPAPKRGRGRPPKVKPPEDAAPSPFSGGVAGDGAGAVGAAAMPDLGAVASMPPDAVAGVLLAMGEVVIVAAASTRYGPDVSRRVFSLSADERATLQPLTAEWLKTSLPKVTPGEMLAVMLCVTLGTKVATAEQIKASMADRQPKAPPPPAPPPKAGSAEASPPTLATV